MLKAALEAQADGKLLVTSKQDFQSAGFIGKASPSAGNIGFEEEVGATLKAEQVTHVVEAKILDMTHANDVIRECGEVSPTLQARMGTGGNQIPLVFEPTYCIQGNTIDRSDTAGANGKGVIEGKSYTLNTVDRPAVAYAVGIQPNNSTSAGGLSDIEEKSPTLSVTKLAGVCYARSGFGEFVESETAGTLRASAAEHGVSSQDVIAQPLSFPTHFEYIHKTDEERCENIPWVLGYERPLIVTEKLDGTSSTYILERIGKRKFEFYVLSRNVRQKNENQKTYHDHNIYWDMAFKYDIENKLKQYLNDNPELKYVCIQGESVGSVQGNPLKLKDDDLYVFNFIRSDVGRLSSVEAKAVIDGMGMKFVPILTTDYRVPSDMEEFKEFATAKSAVNPSVMREGVVLRDPTNDFSFKNVSREYLLKHNG